MSFLAAGLVRAFIRLICTCLFKTRICTYIFLTLFYQENLFSYPPPRSTHPLAFFIAPFRRHGSRLPHSGSFLLSTLRYFLLCFLFLQSLHMFSFLGWR